MIASADPTLLDLALPTGLVSREINQAIWRPDRGRTQRAEVRMVEGVFHVSIPISEKRYGTLGRLELRFSKKTPTYSEIGVRSSPSRLAMSHQEPDSIFLKVHAALSRTGEMKLQIK